MATLLQSGAPKPTPLATPTAQVNLQPAGSTGSTSSSPPPLGSAVGSAGVGGGVSGPQPYRATLPALGKALGGMGAPALQQQQQQRSGGGLTPQDVRDYAINGVPLPTAQELSRRSGSKLAPTQTATAQPTGPAPTGDYATDRSADMRAMIDDFDRQGNQRVAGDIRSAGQQAAKFGRLGSGMVEGDVGNIENQFQRDRMSYLTNLASTQFGRNLDQAQFEEQAQNDAFNRSLATADFTSKGRKQQAAYDRAQQAQKDADAAAASTGTLLSQYAYNQQYPQGSPAVPGQRLPLPATPPYSGH